MTQLTMTPDAIASYQRLAVTLGDSIASFIEEHPTLEVWEVCLVLSMATMGIHIALAQTEEETP